MLTIDEICRFYEEKYKCATNAGIFDKNSRKSVRFDCLSFHAFYILNIFDDFTLKTVVESDMDYIFPNIYRREDNDSIFTLHLTKEQELEYTMLYFL